MSRVASANRRLGLCPSLALLSLPRPLFPKKCHKRQFFGKVIGGVAHTHCEIEDKMNMRDNNITVTHANDFARVCY